MNSNLCYAHIDTPTTGNAWRQLPDDERLALAENTIANSLAYKNKILKIVEAKQDGQVILRLLEPVSADKRGSLLLDLEACLKESIDPGLVIWLEPLGDRSSLRNLRGIEVKS